MASDLLKLDAKGISPEALKAVYAGDIQGVMQHPGVVTLVARRKERLRRIMDELNNPGSHLPVAKPEPGAMPAEAAIEGPPPGPAAPGSPAAPSNLLGMFEDPAAQGAPAGAKISSVHPAELVKSSNGDMLAYFRDNPKKLKEKQERDKAKERRKAAKKRPQEMPGAATVTATKAANVVRVGAYKYGFFRKVAELGLMPSEFMKAADEGGGGALGWLGDKALSAGKTVATAPMIAAPIIGALLGGGYRSATAPEYESPEELRGLEMLGLYKKLARQALLRAHKLQQARLAAMGGDEKPIKIPAVA